MKEIRIPKERLIQFIRQEAAAMVGLPLDQLGACAIFMQTDEGHRPLDVIVDYEPRDPNNWFPRVRSH
jgi:hypothetical protein